MNECVEPSLRNKDIEETIIALEKEALRRWNNGDPDGFLDLSSGDVVYTDNALQSKFVGKKSLGTYYDLIRGKIKIDDYKMIDPVVLSSAGTAVLVYDYEARRDGQLFRMHCTEVYRSCPAGRWEIVHTHWSMVAAENS